MWTHASIWMKLESIMPSQGSQTNQTTSTHSYAISQTASLQRQKVHLQLLELGPGRKWEANANRGFLAMNVVKMVVQL